MIGALLGLAGAGLGAFGQYMQGQQAQHAAGYNARLLDRQALLTEQTMSSETDLMNQNARELKSSQRAAYAASGADISGGTPLIVMAEQAGRMQKDILQQRRNRMIEAQGYRQQAAMSRYEGKVARRTGIFNAGTTLLGGAGKAGMSLL